jgi:hypothetical protein
MADVRRINQLHMSDHGTRIARAVELPGVRQGVEGDPDGAVADGMDVDLQSVSVEGRHPG